MDRKSRRWNDKKMQTFMDKMASHTATASHMATINSVTAAATAGQPPARQVGNREMKEFHDIMSHLMNASYNQEGSIATPKTDVSTFGGRPIGAPTPMSSAANSENVRKSRMTLHCSAGGRCERLVERIKSYSSEYGGFNRLMGVELSDSNCFLKHTRADLWDVWRLDAFATTDDHTNWITEDQRQWDEIATVHEQLQRAAVQKTKHESAIQWLLQDAAFAMAEQTSLRNVSALKLERAQLVDRMVAIDAQLITDQSMVKAAGELRLDHRRSITNPQTASSAHESVSNTAGGEVLRSPLASIDTKRADIKSEPKCSEIVQVATLVPDVRLDVASTGRHATKVDALIPPPPPPLTEKGRRMQAWFDKQERDADEAEAADVRFIKSVTSMAVIPSMGDAASRLKHQETAEIAHLAELVSELQQQAETLVVTPSPVVGGANNTGGTTKKAIKGRADNMSARGSAVVSAGTTSGVLARLDKMDKSAREQACKTALEPFQPVLTKERAALDRTVTVLQQGEAFLKLAPCVEGVQCLKLRKWCLATVVSMAPKHGCWRVDDWQTWLNKHSRREQRGCHGRHSTALYAQVLAEMSDECFQALDFCSDALLLYRGRASAICWMLILQSAEQHGLARDLGAIIAAYCCVPFAYVPPVERFLVVSNSDTPTKTYTCRCKTADDRERKPAPFYPFRVNQVTAPHRKEDKIRTCRHCLHAAGRTEELKMFDEYDQASAPIVTLETTGCLTTHYYQCDQCKCHWGLYRLPSHVAFLIPAAVQSTLVRFGLRMIDVNQYFWDYRSEQKLPELCFRRATVTAPSEPHLSIPTIGTTWSGVPSADGTCDPIRHGREYYTGVWRHNMYAKSDVCSCGEPKGREARACLQHHIVGKESVGLAMCDDCRDAFFGLTSHDSVKCPCNITTERKDSPVQVIAPLRHLPRELSPVKETLWSSIMQRSKIANFVQSLTSNASSTACNHCRRTRTLGLTLLSDVLRPRH